METRHATPAEEATSELEIARDSIESATNSLREHEIHEQLCHELSRVQSSIQDAIDDIECETGKDEPVPEPESDEGLTALANEYGEELNLRKSALFAGDVVVVTPEQIPSVHIVSVEDFRRWLKDRGAIS